MPIPELTQRKTGTHKHPKHNSGKFWLKIKNFGIKIKQIFKRPTTKTWLKRLLWVALICFVLGIIAVIGLFAWISKDLPDPERISDTVPINSISFYDRTGETLLFEMGDTVQKSVEWDKVPKNLINATIALEDRAYYTHHGFSIKGIMRAAVQNVFNLDSSGQGGSTLTQQLIKNVIVGGDKSYLRKIKEVILAVELERRFTKDQILELYFNRVYYGRFHMGVAGAARDYFGKDLEQLSLAECATLASIPNYPPYYIDHPEELKIRRDYGLQIMAEEGYITTEEAEAAKLEPVNAIKERTGNITAPHFVFYAHDELTQEFGSAYLQHAGLKVTTTLDLNKQTIAEEAIKNGMEKIEAYGGSNAGLVALDTHTGQILAMVGSKDFFAEDYDGQFNVTTAGRQPGSSFKPLVYYTAFKKGYSPNTLLYDIETDFPTSTGTYHPHNYSMNASGPLTMRNALARSLNIPAVKTMYLTGVKNVLDTTDALGYTTLTDRDNYGLALALGAGSVTLLDHTSAYATFSREGERHPVSAVLKVEDQSGKVIKEWKDNPQQVLDQQAVRELNDVLSDQGARAWAPILNLPGRATAAKTGTTNDFYDAWTMGYTPSLACGVWTGNNDYIAMKRSADGSIVAAPIWHEFMEKALADTPAETFKKPAASDANKLVLQGKEETVIKKVDKLTNKIIPDSCLETYPAEYTADKEFKVAHTILYYLDKDTPLGDAPKDPTKDSMYKSWQTALDNYIADKSEYLPNDETKITYEDCTLRNPELAPKVKILSPLDQAEVAKKDFLLQTKVTPGAGRTITKVDFIIDVITIDSQTINSSKAATLTADFLPTTLSEVSHTLTITATDNTGTQTSASIKFTYLGKQK